MISLYLRLAKALKTPLIILLDKQYRIPTWQEEGELIRDASHLAGMIDYQPDTYDCDDFAWMFKSEAITQSFNCVGLVIGWHKGWHCWNVILGSEIRYVEPQTGEMFAPGQGYHALLVII